MPHDVTVSGDHAFVAGYGYGLQVIQVFQSEVDVDNNVGQSLAVDGGNSSILQARRLDDTGEYCHLELSANGGESWQGLHPMGAGTSCPPLARISCGARRTRGRSRV